MAQGVYGKGEGKKKRDHPRLGLLADPTEARNSRIVDGQIREENWGKDDRSTYLQRKKSSPKQQGDSSKRKSGGKKRKERQSSVEGGKGGSEKTCSGWLEHNGREAERRWGRDSSRRKGIL